MSDTATAAPTLLPCPFCGNANAIMYDDLLTFHVDCLSCGATGGVSSYRNGAIDAWNTRTQPTPPAVVEPLTDEQIARIARSVLETPVADGVAPAWTLAVGIARAIEAAHGIGIKKGAQDGTL